jgi:NAD(P)-dependent dehydrogenase (short-subunit alcohol dehydrogenase family)
MGGMDHMVAPCPRVTRQCCPAASGTTVIASRQVPPARPEGIGRAIVAALCAEGALVAAADLDEQAVRKMGVPPPDAE